MFIQPWHKDVSLQRRTWLGLESRSYQLGSWEGTDYNGPGPLGRGQRSCLAAGVCRDDIKGAAMAALVKNKVIQDQPRLKLKEERGNRSTRGPEKLNCLQAKSLLSVKMLIFHNILDATKHR